MRVPDDAQDETVDVVIPVYNGERYIAAALRSVAGQTHLPAKIVVVDDGSTDGTALQIRNFTCRVPVEYVYKTNGGPNSARNAGIVSCSSRYIAFLDADDEWYPEKIAEQLKVFRRNAYPDLGAVYCRYEIIDEKGDVTRDHFVLEADPSMRGRIFDRLLFGNRIAGSASAVLIKRYCFDRVGLFDESLRVSEDLDMWLRLSERCSFDFSPGVLVKIRRHGGNIQNDRRYMVVNHVRFLEKWSTRIVMDAGCTAVRRFELARLICACKSVSFARTVIHSLSPSFRDIFFRSTFGSVWLYLIVIMPMTVFPARTPLVSTATGTAELT